MPTGVPENTRGGGRRTIELAALIARIILLILEGLSAREATGRVAAFSAVNHRAVEAPSELVQVAEKWKTGVDCSGLHEALEQILEFRIIETPIALLQRTRNTHRKTQKDVMLLDTMMDLIYLKHFRYCFSEPTHLKQAVL